MAVNGRQPDQGIKEGVVPLPDGRRLGYAEYGDQAGAPVFVFHGWPNSRLFMRSQDEATRRAGVRLIALGRPGFGLSDFKPGRKLIDWPDDVACAADFLGIEKFAVIGHSGGGPYAAACAFKIHKRLTGAAIICGLGPMDHPRALDGMGFFNRISFGLLRDCTPLHRPVLGTGRILGMKLIFRMMTSRLCVSDRVVLGPLNEEFCQYKDMEEAFRNGCDGAAQDLLIYGGPWGVPLGQIPIKVHLWHGEEDRIVPPQMGRYVAQAIPNCAASFLPEEGHFFLFSRWGEILAQVK